MKGMNLMTPDEALDEAYENIDNPCYGCVYTERDSNDRPCNTCMIWLDGYLTPNNYKNKILTVAE